VRDFRVYIVMREKTLKVFTVFAGKRDFRAKLFIASQKFSGQTTPITRDSHNLIRC